MNSIKARSDWIVSRAHDWRGNHDYVCVRCGQKRDSAKALSEGERCIQHYESATSGFKAE
jgi:hypothetical protein